VKNVHAPLLALAVGLTALAPAAEASAQDPQPFTDQEQDLLDAYDVMQGVTMGLMGATATLGLAQIYNLPTVFGEGACARNQAILDGYACSGGLSLIHGGLGIATLGSYIATGVLALAAPNRDLGDEDVVTDVLGVVHGVGIGLTGALGLIAANPEILGIHDGPSRTEFSRVMRVVHWMVALVTVGAFATHLIVDRVD
jgi:hypothetical protein